MSKSKRLRELIAKDSIMLPGVPNAAMARQVERVGFDAVYVSGAGMANATAGVPDIGLLTLTEVAQLAGYIARAVNIPAIVDADTGFGGSENVARTIRELSRAGAAGCHLEDQVQAKRCGHRPGKELVSAHEMSDRIKAAVDGRKDQSFVLMARTDAHAVEGQKVAIERAQQYVEAGADMIFAEALTTLDEYREFTQAVRVPVLANITEFGKTPLFAVQQFGEVGVALVLYPLSAFRAMNRAAEAVYGAIRNDGTQQRAIERMQTRAELYDVLGYHEYEQKLDELFGRGELRT